MNQVAAAESFLRSLESNRRKWAWSFGPGGRRRVKVMIGQLRRSYVRSGGDAGALADAERRVTSAATTEGGNRYLLVLGTGNQWPTRAPKADRRALAKIELRDRLGQRWDEDLRSSNGLPAPDSVRRRRIAALNGRGIGIRAQGLLELGIAVIENATEADVREMRTRGAAVFENVTVHQPSPPPDERNRAVSDNSADHGWHLKRIGLVDEDGKPNLPEDGAGVVIGVLDTGIDPRHIEFAGADVEFRAYDSEGRYKGGVSPRDYDRNGCHGTMVSGIAAGRRWGVARAASLKVAAVLTQPTERGMSGTLEQIAKGFNWLLTTVEEDRPLVINISLGTTGYHDFLRISVDRAVAAGAVVVCAMGNTGDRTDCETHSSPGNYASSIGVGATDERDEVCPFSGWGRIVEEGDIEKPDLCAPGAGVYGPVRRRDELVSTRYWPNNGTSFAAPIVSGVAALLKQRQAELEQHQLKNALLRAARPLEGPANCRAGAGILDVSRIRL